MLGLSLALSLAAMQNNPAWWIMPAATTDLDFVNGRYYNGAVTSSASGVITTVRASAAISATVAGALVSFAANVPRITDQGLRVEEARTNKSTNFNAAPVALTNATIALQATNGLTTLNLVSDVAAIQATTALAGLYAQGILNGNVFQLDNSLGDSVAVVRFTGNTGVSDPHAASAYVRGGAGSISVYKAAGSTSSAGGETAFTASATYVRRTHLSTLPDTNMAGGVKANAGEVIYIILNQLEAGAFASSSIVIAGAAATRAADVISLTGAAATAALASKAAYHEIGGVAAAGGNIFYYANSQNNHIVNGTSTLRIRASNGTTPSATIGSGLTTGPTKAAYAYDATNCTVRGNGGAIGTNVNAWAGTTGTPIIGSDNSGTFSINGYIKRMAFGATKGQFDGLTA